MDFAREALLERVHARDATCDGEFLFAVVTTGVYCRPSCRSRRARDENVRFFANEDEALRAGFRACRRCRPDQFLRARDPDLERFERAIGVLRARPQSVDGVTSLARTAAVGVTKLCELARRHFHATPLELIRRARVDAARRRLLDTRDSVAEIGYAVGFESASTFYDNFRALNGAAPGDWRRALGRDQIELELPAGYRADLARAFLLRDPQSPTERSRGNGWVRALRVGQRAVAVDLELGADRLRARIAASPRLDRREMHDVHAAIVRMLGLACDPTAFERKVASDVGLIPLLGDRRGLRVALGPSVFEMLVWTVIAQQVNLRFAFQCRRALIERLGVRLSDDLHAHPTPSDLAGCDETELSRLGLSRAKASYLIDASRAIVAGALDLEGLARLSATRAERTLLAVRGLGPWSVQAILMRGAGFADCAPIGDAGLARSLQEFFRLDQRPNETKQVEVLARFAPHRSLASFHLWRRLGNTP